MDLEGLPDPVKSHPDMQLVIPAEGVVVHAPNLHPQVAELLKDLGYILVSGKKRLPEAILGIFPTMWPLWAITPS